LPKATEAFRNIGEVSTELAVRKHVLRFWEAKFPQLKPMKRGGGRRYYRPADIQLLRGIRYLLQTEGYTIKGVQKILREDGIDDVKKLGAQEEERRAAKPSHGTVVDTPRHFSAAEVSALRSIAAELSAVRAILAGSSEQGAQQSGRRQKRAGARA
jgi:DNA-binding transcriptional MerR regulator